MAPFRTRPDGAFILFFARRFAEPGVLAGSVFIRGMDGVRRAGPPKVGEVRIAHLAVGEDGLLSAAVAMEHVEEHVTAVANGEPVSAFPAEGCVFLAD